MAPSVDGLGDFCRLCAIKITTGVVIYSTEGESLGLEEKISSCLRIEVTRNDLLPKRICQSCNLLLEDYYRFAEKAAQVQQTLYILLGLQPSHPHEESTELCLARDEVKSESKLIKKEIDEYGEDWRSDFTKDVSAKVQTCHNKKSSKTSNAGENTGRKPNTENLEPEYIQSLGQYSLGREKLKCFVPEVFQHTARAHFESHSWVLNKTESPVFVWSGCEKSLERTAASRQSHVQEHLSKNRFRCRICSRKFCSKKLLQIHLTCIHGQASVHVCHKCGRSHLGAEECEFKCKECGKTLQTRGGLAGHLSVHKLGRHFMCHICGKTFTQKINMQQHVKHHGGERPHSCDLCHRRFTEKSHLIRHKISHSDDRPFQCSTCQKTYKTERCLKAHEQIHGDERPHVCSYCGKGFLSSAKLKQHHNCHTGERPFACKHCDRTFTNYPNLLKHTRRRHATNQETGLAGLKNGGREPVTPRPRG